MRKIRVLVVDDSALVRKLLRAIIDAQRDMECVGAAADALHARTMIRTLDPDVLTLDVEMPKMDGLEFLAKLMQLRPMPVVMVSTLTERGAQSALTALELGAVDFVAKPRSGFGKGLDSSAAEIVEKLRAASTARIRRRVVAPPTDPAGSAAAAWHDPQDGKTRSQSPAHSVTGSRAASSGGFADLLPDFAQPDPKRASGALVAIGASTGGTEAIRAVLGGLPAQCPPIVIVQHMPAGFTRSFAVRLDGLCRLRVAEASHGEVLRSGHVYIAPGGSHLSVVRRGEGYVAALGDGARVNRHRPSVEVLFDSVATQVGRRAIGLMLSGMGRDGADAMRRMRDAGGWNIAQDEASCVVYGMPREAIAAGAVDEVAPLASIAARLLARLAQDPT